MNTLCISLSILFLFIIFKYLYDKNRAKNKVVKINEDKCIGCRRCLKKCRRHVLDIVNDETKIRVVVKFPTQCTACGNCVVVCKYHALNIVRRNSQHK